MERGAAVKGRYCCFNDPTDDHSIRDIDDVCPVCGMQYSFPLTHHPAYVAQYRIVNAISRGFYGATYRAEVGGLERLCVLKVVPKGVYEFFGKDFAEECRLHQSIAKGSEHVVGILDMFEADVDFQGRTVPCHVCELDFVDGMPLSEFEGKSELCSATAIAQVAIDLLRLLFELESRQRYHNDLHSNNIVVQQLPKEWPRGDEVDRSIRAIAIDLGSSADRSKSGADQRLGDLGQVVTHLLTLRDRLLDSPESTSDNDYRLAWILDDVAHALTSPAAGLRAPQYLDLANQIREGFTAVSSPWARPPALKHFSEAYNAQQLHPWFVPQLLVDPDGSWLPRVSGRGPLLITGMRGCGKTMLLRALQFHARVSAAQIGADRGVAGTAVLEFLQADGYVGLYQSCTRLLGKPGSGVLHQPYARLFLAYAREALRAARHLQQVHPSSVPSTYWEPIARVLDLYLGSKTGLGDAATSMQVENLLLRFLVQVESGTDDFSLSANPAVAFPALAEAIQSMIPAWQNSYVLFLLDDVSTRHLSEPGISELLGTLLFQNPSCAFKMTTEAQTLEMILRSPGLIESARPGRDYETFDLAAEVSERLRMKAGVPFVSKILEHRASRLTNHPAASPVALLGDESLESLARGIASTGRTASARKSTYHGVRALAGVCVGDIGDVLSIYESMVGKTDGRTVPIPARKQSECYQEYCARRLFQLSRHGDFLKNHALAFGQAAHELLMKSSKDPSREEKDAGSRRNRLRQYSKIYVRLTAGDTRHQFELIRQLTDAGVFVLEGGSETPRSKTKDSDPIQQFILSYRKLLGLSNYIGLADSDRFELSGTELEEWLEHPEQAREVLMRNLGGSMPEDEEAAEDDDVALVAPAQLVMTEEIDEPEQPVDSTTKSSKQLVSRFSVIEHDTLSGASLDVLVLGLGFEERTLESVRRLLETAAVKHAVAIRYQEPGKSDEILRLLDEAGVAVTELKYETGEWAGFTLPEGEAGVDVTGLAKPVLFEFIRQAMQSRRRAWVVHTEAKTHYPLNEDIEEVLRRGDGLDDYALLEAAGKIWYGEKEPYEFVGLLSRISDPSRRRVLCAAASAKHARLSTLLEGESFDHVEIIAPGTDTPRSALARLAADVATRGLPSHHIEFIDSDDLAGHLTFIARQVADYYIDAGFEIELGLTGSKMHAAACAVASSIYKPAQCWYVKPAGFDAARFTSGSGETGYFEVMAGAQRGSD